MSVFVAGTPGNHRIQRGDGLATIYSKRQYMLRIATALG